ncbi:hypothetical protein [Saccharolobus islandicus]|uniref:Uncharacterized protein n=2 Tax=Saccharolobus islandicus TaxID=43080 RepID=C3MXA3_SACI4|nr:hypothetical protein [Sulfolobus islandicus]ACP37783.1 hypothetical protein M1425_1013 [Sulfolobus islandicus M.14.25]ACP54977.1 hypothetical protein M1627_1076 [Sulfolobus islandicus M.16.27]
MSQGKDYLVDAVNYISYMSILQRISFEKFCNHPHEFYCNDGDRRGIWENVRSIFRILLSTDEFNYLSGNNPQGIDYFLDNEPEQIIRQTCKTTFYEGEIINNLIEYELKTMKNLKKLT